MATINFFNDVTQITSNQILLFLQPINPQENYLFSAWNVLNPSIGSVQSVNLTNTFSGSIATFADIRGNYSLPVALPLGVALEITDPNDQSPVIGLPDPSRPITSEQVGLYNNTSTSPVNLSVVWYVNGLPVVETNNTAATTLNPGFTSTFQLKQSIFCMLGQQPTSTTTFTLQTFSSMTEFPVPNDATEINIEVVTVNGRDIFRLLPPEVTFEQLVRERRGRHKRAA